MVKNGRNKSIITEARVLWRQLIEHYTSVCDVRFGIVM